MEENPPSPHRGNDATRRSLLLRLKNQEDHESWSEFFELYWRLIYNLGIQNGLTPTEAEDAVQETVITMIKNLPNFDYDPRIGSFRAWLRKTARWRIADQFRKRLPLNSPALRGEEALKALHQIPDPESLISDERWEREWLLNLKEVALDRVRAKVSPRQFQLFDLFTLQNKPMEEIQDLLDVSRNVVYLATHRIKGLLIDEMKKLKAAD